MPSASFWRRAAVVAAVLGPVAVPPAPLPAQASTPAPADSLALPFRPRQWGAEFGLGSYTSVGLLRFRAPHRAWVGTVRADYERLTPPDGAVRSDASTVDLALGHRWYRAVLPDVAQFVSIAGVVGRESARQWSPQDESRAPPVSRSATWTGGVTADIGAQWTVTPSLALGAQWGARAELARTRNRVRLQGTERSGRSHGMSLSLGQIGILATLFF